MTAELPSYQPFYLETSDALRAEISRLGLEIAVDENLAPLAQALAIGNKTATNRFCAQPIVGCDADANEAPSDRTRRRYRRLASGGFGLIWIESTVAGTTGERAQLCLHERTLESFRALVDEMRGVASAAPLIVLQLTSGRFTPELSDAEIEERRDALIATAGLAARAGFDGVDVQCCQGSLASTLLRPSTREGSFGGTFENRSRFLLETLAGIREQQPDLLLTSRLCAFDAARGSFGVSSVDYRQPDLNEPVRLAKLLRETGLSLLNVTAASPNLRGADRATRPHDDAANPDEHPLMTLNRQLQLARVLREAAPGLPVIGSGFSWLRQFVPQVAAGAIHTGAIDIVGLGRTALAHPSAPAEIFEHGRMAQGSTCMVCFACLDLRAENEPVGCVIRDAAAYGPIYRAMRRLDPDRLIAGARRCHFCESAPCVSASPTRTDIPAIIKAFLDGDERKASEIIRLRDPLPEMTAQLSPGWLQSEGACIETTLTGVPVPILDLQYAVSWRARDRGETGVRVPALGSGKTVAIIGGGPTGISAAARILEQGHAVELFEKCHQLGGAPARVIPETRLSDVRGEIDALLAPGIAAGRVRVHLGAALGEDFTLAELRARNDAVLIAVGLWDEQSLGAAPGVVGALSFLESAKRKDVASVPERVAILAGGDSAMDAARVVQRLGAKEVFIIFGGPRSELHWHMEEGWFAAAGVHALMNWEPLGFDSDSSGQMSGVRIRHTELQTESVLRVGLVIEAMGLQIAPSVQHALAGVSLSQGTGSHRTNLAGVYAAGAVINGGASVAHCVAEGLAAAFVIHHDLTISPP